MKDRGSCLMRAGIFVGGVASAAVLTLPLLARAADPGSPAPIHDFEIERGWLTVEDGTRLAVTYFRPVAREDGERFPVLLELLPYRKDDLFYLRDYPIYSYFAGRGYVLAKVDIRGTGSSEGSVPPREYSEVELKDAVDIIDQLSRKPWSNGNIGMWGISWGGFNAIQVAMRRPPALKAILAIDASDDLFHDDVHYIDGAFHVDQYELRIDTKHGLPRWPDYSLDEDYFRERFNAYPWFLTYLKQQRDGLFWRRNSLRWNYQALQVPTYLIGGLLDGYRDSIPRMLAEVKAPMKAVIGPWVHAWPDNGKPGPNYEWRHEAVRWWDYWLRGRDTGIMAEPTIAVFVRDSHLPDARLDMTPGHWRYEDWPIERTTTTSVYPSAGHRLTWSEGTPSSDRLEYVPSFGHAAGYWWGEPTGDMRSADAGSLVYDSDVLKENIEIVGLPRAFLKVASSARLAHWIVRLEDVHPGGAVSLVTGALINGSQLRSRLDPEHLIPGKTYDLRLPLHFTTWTFKPGHRIRLAVSNALFPMIWPTPYRMTTQLFLGTETTRLELPVIAGDERQVPAFLPPQPREMRPDGRSLESKGWPYRHQVIRDLNRDTTTVEWAGESWMEIQGCRYFASDQTSYQVNDADPAESSFRGVTVRKILLEDRPLELKTMIHLRSDKESFHVTFTRQIFQRGELVRKRGWEETIPRDFQ